ncbi:MAG TPA: PEPxxWA-CTERM sorting domain-containing protein [Phenylobacterium sp.]|jgi:hypothetical protein|nr:PEPxxWA-CTERM sorting domain-containing protein [Phenylobacterium sp.]
MTFKLILAGATATVAMLAAGAAFAANNDPPPAGPVILNLAGTPIPTSYTQYTANFTAASALTNLSFAFREDPAFLLLDNFSLTDTTTPSGELVTNGGFETPPVGVNAPTGWTYLNTFGAAFAGVVTAGCGIGASNCYRDGAVQAYDAITQAITTHSGDVYHLSFQLMDNGSAGTFSALSTNGDVTDTGGNGRNLVVYAGAVPTRAGVPEPGSWALLLLGFGGIGAALRSRRRMASFA